MHIALALLLFMLLTGVSFSQWVAGAFKTLLRAAAAVVAFRLLFSLMSGLTIAQGLWVIFGVWAALALILEVGRRWYNKAHPDAPISALNGKIRPKGPA